MAISRDESWRVHVQHATASDASVVIQVGRDLYLSDASLSALWTPGETMPGECPFPGLDAFGPGQAKWFFGRRQLTGDLLQELDAALRAGPGDARTGGPVLVVGPSGAGKSSLLGAGLLAALGEGRLPAPGSDSWPRLLFTPGVHPLQTLREALATCAEAQDSRSGARIVIVVDQLEEIFTACRDEAERSGFLAALADLASGQGPISGPASAGDGPAALVVLGLRADFYAQATGYPVLRAALGGRQIVLGAMTAAEIRQAIILPARAAGLTIEGGLAERLLRDLGVDEAGGYEPGRLPLLAHALRATWQHRDGDRLTIAGYEATGGIGGAIAKTAEDVFARLEEVGQRAARQVFLALVRVGEAAGDADGEGTADTRRRVSAESLYAQAPDPEAARDVLSAFTAARLLTSGGQAVEINHEALLRRWPRLRAWIGEDRAGHLIRQGLEEAAASWDRDGRDTSGLYSGVRLAAAQAWAGAAEPLRLLSRVGRDFLAASDRRRRRGIRRRNEIIGALTALSLALAGLAGFAFIQRHTADIQRANAESNYRQAKAGVTADAAVTAMSDHGWDTAMELAVQAQRLAPTAPPALSALLSTQAQPIVGRLPVSGQHSSQVLGVAYHPDGAIIATSTGDGYVQLWSASTYRQLAAIQLTAGGETDAVHDVVFSPDGRTLVATVSGGVRLLHVTSTGHLGPAGFLGTDTTKWGALAAAFSPDGRTLAVADADNRVLLWNMATRTLASSFVPGGAVIGLAFAAGGRMLATATVAGTVDLWDIARRSLAVVFSPEHAQLGAIAVSPDGQTLAFSAQTAGASPQPAVMLWSLRSRRATATLTGLTGAARTVAFSPDGRLLAAAGLDDSVRLWDLRNTQVPLDTLTGKYPVEHVAFSPDGATLASASDDGTVALWDVRGNTLADLADPATSVAFSPDGRTLAVGTKIGGISVVALYSMPARKLIAILPAASAPVVNIAFSPDGRMLAAALYDPPSEPVQLWNVASHRLAGHIATYQKSLIRGLAFSPDGRLIATTGTEDPTVRLWSTTRLTQAAAHTANEWSTIGPDVFQWGVAFSPDGRLIAVAGSDGETRVYSFPGFRLVGICVEESAPSTLAFSPDGRTLAIGDLDGTVYLYDVHPVTSPGPGAPLWTVAGALAESAQPIASLTFEAGSKALAAAGWDGAIRLWNVADRTLSASITTGGGKIADAAYSGSLGLIVTADGQVTRVWQTDPGQVAASICRTLQTPVSRQAWHDYLPGYPYTPICG